MTHHHEEATTPEPTPEPEPAEVPDETTPEEGETDATPPEE